MKKYYYILLFVLACLCLPFLASCDDEDDESNGPSPETSIVNPRKVFTAGLPTLVGGNKITTDDNGRVVKMERENLLVTFDYSALTRAAKADVVMTIESDDVTSVCNLTLNDQGFVSFCDESSHNELDGDEHQTWKFTYDSYGHLTKMVRSEGGNETTTITWEDGNITDVRVVSEEYPDDASHYTITYWYTNEGGIMFFDEMFGIDMDEMSFAYWAGLLGKPTALLPDYRYDAVSGEKEVFGYDRDEEYRAIRFYTEENRYFIIEW